MKEAKLYQKVNKNLVECTACFWQCKIAEGNFGTCKTRVNKKGKLYSLVYGKVLGLSLDPIEKKPLFHFLPGQKILSFGSFGCNFNCQFCQNWQMSQTNKFFNWADELEKFIDQNSVAISPQEIVNKAIKEKASGIAYTYSEPAIFAEFAYDTAKIAKTKGLKNILVSNGFWSQESFDYIKPVIDAVNIDLKSFNPEFYQKICGAKIDPVLENIKRFFTAGIETEITTLIIPNENDSPKELGQIAEFIASVSKDIPWHLSTFYPQYKMQNIPITPKETLLTAYEIGKSKGLKYVYAGNILDKKLSSTFCPKCNSLLVSRSGYNTKLENIDLKKGQCKKCQEKIYGFSSKTWTSKI